MLKFYLRDLVLTLTLPYKFVGPACKSGALHITTKLVENHC